MIQLLKRLDFPLLEMQPIIEYFKQFENYKIIKEDIESDNGEIHVAFQDEQIKIVYTEISEGKFWSIYRYHSNGMKYEQIDAITFDEIKESGYNKVIKFSGHIEDNKYSYITCSGFSYSNSEIIKSWKKTRAVPIQDLQKIQHSKNMNLTELILMTDHKSNNIIKKEEQKDIKTHVLKLGKL